MRSAATSGSVADVLTCRELVELVSDYHEGGLSVDERLAFERHVAICPPCRGYLDELRSTIAVAGSLSEDSLAPPARDAMLHVFRDWRRRG
jgi:anti-sigma factor RsiW